MIDGLQQNNISLNKGIVRTPSLGEEGELSECVNLIPYAGEMVRIKEPQPLTWDVRGLYFYYTYCLDKVENGYLFSVVLAQPAWGEVAVTVTYYDKQSGSERYERLFIGQGEFTKSITFMGIEGTKDIREVEMDGELFFPYLKEHGYSAIKAHRLFEMDVDDVEFPFEVPEEETNAPVTLMPGEILLATHRCDGEENLIVHSGQSLVYYRSKIGRQFIANFGEEDYEVATMGYCLIVTVKGSKTYYVWEKDGYKEQDIHHAIPKADFSFGEPAPYFYNYNAYLGLDAQENPIPGAIVMSHSYGIDAELHGLVSADNNINKITNVLNKEHKEVYGSYTEFVNAFWSVYTQTREYWKKAGRFCYPFFVRWGVQLYDNSVINLSAPILMTPSSIIRPGFGIFAPGGKDTPDPDNPGIGQPAKDLLRSVVPMLMARRMYAAFDASALGGLSEKLVKGIVIYITPEIEVTSIEYEAPESSDDGLWHSYLVFTPNDKAEDSFGGKIPIYGISHDYTLYKDASGIDYFNLVWYPPTKEDLSADAQKFQDPVEFYQLTTIPLSWLKENDYRGYVSFGDGTDLLELPGYIDKNNNFVEGRAPQRTIENKFYEMLYKGYAPMEIRQDILTALTSQPQLADVQVSQSELIVGAANSSYSYNSRMLYGGVTLINNPALRVGQFLANYNWMMGNWLRSPKVYIEFQDKYLTVVPEEFLLDYFHGLTPFIALPFKDATGIYIADDEQGYYLPLVQNSTSLLGYPTYCAITEPDLKTKTDLSEFATPLSTMPEKWRANNYLSATGGANFRPNTIAVTKVANPWIIEQVIDLSCGEIYELTSATDALSEGQFGDFPVYAFTDNGIYALSISNEGVIEAKQPLSRDVILYQNKALQIDKGVLFPTKQGLKSLTGRNTQLISSSVEGLNVSEEEYDLPDDLLIEDKLPFSQQLPNCKMVYDYAHQLIHVFVPGENMITTGGSEGWKVETRKQVYEIASGTRITQVKNPSLGFGLTWKYYYPTPGIEEPWQYYYISALTAELNLNLNNPYMFTTPVVVEVKKGEPFKILKGKNDNYTFAYARILGAEIRAVTTEDIKIGYQDDVAKTKININSTRTFNCDTVLAFDEETAPREWQITKNLPYFENGEYTSETASPVTQKHYRQKHYVYSLETGQWSTQILEEALTTVVPGYPYSTMQFGSALKQYTMELEADVLRSGWLLTRPVAFGDPFVRKMLADIRIMGQKTLEGSRFKVAVYISNDRQHWKRLNSLKSRSAKWYRFLIKADMGGLDTLTGMACQYVPRFGSKLR